MTDVGPQARSAEKAANGLIERAHILQQLNEKRALFGSNHSIGDETISCRPICVSIFTQNQNGVSNGQ